MGLKSILTIGRKCVLVVIVQVPQAGKECCYENHKNNTATTAGRP
jgi:hypothetical protein